ncbi:MAG: HAD family hydrolase [Eubacterium sp.]
MRYQTIIFDLDGTLLNTLEDLRDSVNVIMERFGWKTHSLEEIRRFVGNGIGKLMERATPEGKGNPHFEQAFEEFRAYYTDHCQIKTRAYDGVVELMNELKENGAKLAIVSNKNDVAVKELNEIYFSGCVSVAIGEMEGRQRKPAPDEVYAALDELGSTKEDAVYIGDSEVDYETAQASGLPCVLVSWGFRDKELLESFDAEKVVDNVKDLREFLFDFTK